MSSTESCNAETGRSPHLASNPGELSGHPDKTTGPEHAFANLSACSECDKLLVLGRSTLWLHRAGSYYILEDHITRMAYLVLGSRAGALEADLQRLGYGEALLAGSRPVSAADLKLQACLRSYCWMGPLEEQALRADDRRGR